MNSQDTISDTETETIELLRLQIHQLSKELHNCMNEDEYAGSRKDWIDRCYTAEYELEKTRKELDLFKRRYLDAVDSR